MFVISIIGSLNLKTLLGNIISNLGCNLSFLGKFKVVFLLIIFWIHIDLSARFSSLFLRLFQDL